MLKKSTIQLLRFHFSFFLLPVYLFALSEVNEFNISRTILIFLILHLLVYPASNGYNSYMDRDKGSIGGVRNPMAPTQELFYTTIVFDAAAVLLALFVHPFFSIGIMIYILVSKSYSYRGIRLKKFPVAGYLTVIIFQGAFTFLLVYFFSSDHFLVHNPTLPAIISTLFIGGFYPLTQIYQHQSDLNDGVTTISYRLGYRGSFIFCGIVYTLALALLFYHYKADGAAWKFVLFMLIMAPVPYFFLKWAIAVWKNDASADFNNTMKMNVIASVCTSIAFLSILLIKIFE